MFEPTDLAELALTALIREAQLTPKPGLVDRRGSGAHDDMDLALLTRSAQTLAPTFATIAELAAEHGRIDLALREEIGALGRAGERAMLAATGGVNTHRGALWSLGLLIAAVGVDRELLGATTLGGASAIAARAARLARLPDRFANVASRTDSHGERVKARFGVTGARGEAQAGFPHARAIVLPAYRHSAAAQSQERWLDGLLASIAALADTCLLYRGGVEGLALARRGARRVLAAGGAGSVSGRAALDQLDAELSARRLSPGGSADVLATAIFLDSLICHGGPEQRRAHDLGALACRS